MYVIKIDPEIFAMLNLDHFISKQGRWGPEDFGAHPTFRKRSKKKSQLSPKKTYPLPFLDKGTHWSFQQSLSRPWWCPFFRILASLKKGWGRLLVTKRTRRIRLANQKKKHNATRLNLNLGDIFFSAKQKKTALLLPKFTGAKLRKGLLYIFPKKNNCLDFPTKFLQNWWAFLGHRFCRVALPTIQPSEPGFWDGNLSNEKGGPFGWSEGISLVGWNNCWWFRNPVNSPVEVGSLAHYLQGFFASQVVSRISEPSTALPTRWFNSWPLRDGVSSRDPLVEGWRLTDLQRLGIKRSRIFHHLAVMWGFVKHEVRIPSFSNQLEYWP